MTFPRRPPTAAGLTSHVRLHLRRAIAFAAVSGSGLAIDLCLFMLLVGSGASPAAASFVSGSAAVSFVYFASVRRIFSYGGEFLLPLFAAYLAYQAAGVTAASWAVGALVRSHFAPLTAKLLILPVTFPANYLFMSFLTQRRRALAGASA